MSPQEEIQNNQGQQGPEQPRLNLTIEDETNGSQGQVPEDKTIPPPTQTTPATKTVEAPKPKRKFSRSINIRTVPVVVHLPLLADEFDPFKFEFRIALSSEAEERRQQWLSLSAAEMTQKEAAQALDEVCDLLVSLPEGFEDLQYDGVSAGSSFRSYYEYTTDADQKALLNKIIVGADSTYWSKITPREFRTKV